MPVSRPFFSDIYKEMRAILDRSGQPQLVVIQSAPSFAAIWILPRRPAFYFPILALICDFGRAKHHLASQLDWSSSFPRKAEIPNVDDGLALGSRVQSIMKIVGGRFRL